MYLRTLSLKISEGYDQFWSKPSEILNLRSSTTTYSRNCSLHATLIPNLVKLLTYTFIVHTYLLMRQWQCSFRVEWDFLDSENYGSLTSPAISKKSIHPEYGCFQDSKWPFKLCSLVVHHLTSSPILFLISHYICLVF